MVEYDLLEDNIHIIPVNDTYEHDISYECWCKPTPDKIAPKMYIHHAWDKREYNENFNLDEYRKKCLN